MTDLVPVRVPCPTGHHPDGDSVSLKPKMGLAGGIAAQQTIREIGTTSLSEVQGILAEVYLRHGVVGWTLHDEADKPIPFTPANLQTHVLDDFEFAVPIANQADALYSTAVVNPLVNAAVRSSRATQAGDSTSAPKGSPRSRRKPSKRSSTSTTPTESTTPTSS